MVSYDKVTLTMFHIHLLKSLFQTTKDLPFVLYRSVGGVLHKNFAQRKESGEDEALNLSQILKKKTKKQSAKFFYQILVSSIHCFIAFVLSNAVGVGVSDIPKKSCRS